MAVEIRRTWRRNSEEQQKATLTLRLGLRRFRSRTQANRFLERPLRGLGAGRAAGDCRPYHWLGRGGRQGTAAPTIGLDAAGGRGLPPLPLVGGVGCRGRGLPPLPLVGGVGCRGGRQGTAAPTIGRPTAPHSTFSTFSTRLNSSPRSPDLHGYIDSPPLPLPSLSAFSAFSA